MRSPPYNEKVKTANPPFQGLFLTGFCLGETHSKGVGNCQKKSSHPCAVVPHDGMSSHDMDLVPHPVPAPSFHIMGWDHMMVIWSIPPSLRRHSLLWDGILWWVFRSQLHPYPFPSTSCDAIPQWEIWHKAWEHWSIFKNSPSPYSLIVNKGGRKSLMEWTSIVVLVSHPSQQTFQHFISLARINRCITYVALSPPKLSSNLQDRFIENHWLELQEEHFYQTTRKSH